MQNLIDFKISSNGETELRKRCLIGNTIKLKDHSKESTCDQTEPHFERELMTTYAPSKVINENTKATKKESTEMTTSGLDTTTNTTITTKPVRTSSAMLIKRSLSESSAEEYHRSNEAALGYSSNNIRKMWHNELIISHDSENTQPERRQQQQHNNDDIGSNKKRIKQKNHFISDMIDVGIRIALVFLFIKLETTSAFHRNIHVEELWLYKNPRTPDFVSPAVLILSVIICPFVVTILQYFLSRDRRDFRAASWVWTLILCLNGLTTSLLKISTGRPRPDFFYRCFPDGQMVANVTQTAVNFNCTGLWRDINEGYKSFPSGHSSFAFASFGFISIYLAGKLHAFNTAGRGESWRLLASVWPLLLATLIAVSRTCDYHHHWQDVLVGGLIGIFVAYLTYRQYYPSIFSLHSHKPFPRDDRYSISHHHHYTHSSHSNKHHYLDNSHINSKDEHLISEDRLPLIYDEDAVEQLNND